MTLFGQPAIARRQPAITCFELSLPDEFLAQKNLEDKLRPNLRSHKGSMRSHVVPKTSEISSTFQIILNRVNRSYGSRDMVKILTGGQSCQQHPLTLDCIFYLRVINSIECFLTKASSKHSSTYSISFKLHFKLQTRIQLLPKHCSTRTI